jgi:hypothetical protein
MTRQRPRATGGRHEHGLDAFTEREQAIVTTAR